MPNTMQNVARSRTFYRFNYLFSNNFTINVKPNVLTLAFYDNIIRISNCVNIYRTRTPEVQFFHYFYKKLLNDNSSPLTTRGDIPAFITTLIYFCNNVSCTYA